MFLYRNKMFEIKKIYFSEKLFSDEAAPGHVNLHQHGNPN